MKGKTGLLVFVVLLAVCFFVQGAFAIDVYTFKKDRVDQSMDGNRGYISGNAPAAPDRGNPKRTLIGVDVELPAIGPDFEEEEPAAAMEQKATSPATTVVGTPKPETVMKKAYREEDWIK